MEAEEVAKKLKAHTVLQDKVQIVWEKGGVTLAQARVRVMSENQKSST